MYRMRMQMMSHAASGTGSERFLNLHSGRDANLNGYDFLLPFRMVGQKISEGHAFLWHALDIIEAVDVEDDFFAPKLSFELENALLNARALQHFNLSVGVYSNWKDSGIGKVIHIRETRWAVVQAEDAGANAEKMAGIFIGINADEFRSQNALKDLATDGRNAVDVGAGKQGMQEKADGDIADAFSQQAWEQHEMVILSPD